MTIVAVLIMVAMIVAVLNMDVVAVDIMYHDFQPPKIVRIYGKDFIEELGRVAVATGLLADDNNFVAIATANETDKAARPAGDQALRRIEAKEGPSVLHLAARPAGDQAPRRIEAKEGPSILRLADVLTRMAKTVVDQAPWRIEAQEGPSVSRLVEGQVYLLRGAEEAYSDGKNCAARKAADITSTTASKADDQAPRRIEAHEGPSVISSCDGQDHVRWDAEEADLAVLSNLPAIFALLNILFSRISAGLHYLVDWTSGDEGFFLFLLLLFTACVVLAFNVVGRPDYVKVPGGIPFNMGGRLGGNYVPKFENCGVPIAQLIHEVAGSLCLDMGGGPVGYGTVWFVMLSL